MAHAQAEPPTVDLATYFAALSEWWHESTDVLSSPSEKAEHPAYQRVIAMGAAAVPYMLREIDETQGGDWYIALRRILGFSPVPPEAAASSKAVRDAWLAWGRSAGVI
ncbi:MAG: hypothetical protein ACSLFM_06360 [Tepidiformaceae bacterium]